MPARSSQSWFEQKVSAADGNPQAWMGSAVSISGDFAVVGAKNATVNGREHQGAAYVYQKVGGTWKQLQKLTASDGVGNDQFGASVALFGQVAIVTAPFARVNGRTWQGAAYVFAITAQGCKQTQKIMAKAGAAFDTFGTLVRMDSTWAFISAGGAVHLGQVIPHRVFVFKNNPKGSSASWSEHSVLNFPNPEDETSSFGISIAVLDSKLLIGARTATPFGEPGQGAAYMYTLRAKNWELDTRITATDGAARDNFGVSVALAGKEAFIGSFGATINGNVSQGAVYRFADSDGQWVQVQKIVANDGAASNLFGASMSWSKYRLLVGAYGVDDYRGAAYVFAPRAGQWQQIKTLKASDGAARDVYAYYSALSDKDALIGAYGANIGSNLRQGAAYFYALPQKTLATASLEETGNQSKP